MKNFENKIKESLLVGLQIDKHYITSLRDDKSNAIYKPKRSLKIKNKMRGKIK